MHPCVWGLGPHARAQTCYTSRPYGRETYRMKDEQVEVDEAGVPVTPVRDIGAAVVVIGVTVWLWSVSLDFPDDAGDYVRLILSGIIGLSLLQIVRGIVLLVARRSSIRASDQDAGPTSPTAAASDGGVVGASADTSAVHADQSTERDDQRDRPWLRRDNNFGWVFLGASIVYVMLLPAFGYIVMTAIFLIGLVSFAIGWSIRTALGLLAVIAVMYLVASYILNISMPEGIFI